MATGPRAREVVRSKKAGTFAVSRQLVVLANILKRSEGARYRRLLGLSGSDWGVIAQLGERAPRTLNDLADSMGVDKTQISRSVASLVERGLLNRDMNPEDQREVRITLTRAGLDTEAVIRQGVGQVNRTLLQGLSQSQREILEQQLDMFMARAEEMLHNEQELGGE